MDYEEALAHFGVKGMHWGVRRNRGPAADASEDVKKVAKIKTKLGRGGNTEKLSNKELQDLVTRMNLEKQFSTLQPQSTSTLKKTRAFINQTLQDVRTVNDIANFTRSPVGKSLTSQLRKG